MIRKILLTGLAAVAGMLLSAAPAQAASFNTNLYFPASRGNPGSFNVIVDHVAGSTNSWSIQVKSNKDFKLATPEHNVSMVAITFLDRNGNVINSDGEDGRLADTGFGTVNGNTWDFTPGTADLSLNDPGGFGSRGKFNIAMDGSTTFNGQITLANGSWTDVAAISVTLKNGTAISGEVAVTPEPISLALLLPGLAPMGVAMLRRRKKGEESSEEELTA